MELGVGVGIQAVQPCYSSRRSGPYLASVTGVTGARRELPAGPQEMIGRVRAVTDKPVAVGFGIADAGQARIVGQAADGVVVGSAIVERAGRRDAPYESVRSFVLSLRNALVN